MEAIETIGKIIIACFVVAALALIMGLPVMWLWNWLMPAIFGLKAITFSQSVGINLLCSILFKNDSSPKGS